MSWLSVIEAGVLRFETVDGAVEAERFGSDFGDEVAGDVSLKAGGIVGFWIGEKITVDERSDRFSMHDGQGCR